MKTLISIHSAILLLALIAISYVGTTQAEASYSAVNNQHYGEPHRHLDGSRYDRAKRAAAQNLNYGQNGRINTPPMPVFADEATKIINRTTVVVPPANVTEEANIIVQPIVEKVIQPVIKPVPVAVVTNGTGKYSSLIAPHIWRAYLHWEESLTLWYRFTSRHSYSYLD